MPPCELLLHTESLLAARLLEQVCGWDPTTTGPAELAITMSCSFTDIFRSVAITISYN